MSSPESVFSGVVFGGAVGSVAHRDCHGSHLQFHCPTAAVWEQSQLSVGKPDDFFVCNTTKLSQLPKIVLLAVLSHQWDVLSHYSNAMGHPKKKKKKRRVLVFVLRVLFCFVLF